VPADPLDPQWTWSITSAAVFQQGLLSLVELLVGHRMSGGAG
jgi:hypothetical protein